MVYNIKNYWVFRVCQFFDIPNKKLDNTTFRKLDLLRFSGDGETPTLLGPLKAANLNHWKETDPISETLCSRVFRIHDDGESPKPQ
jgi:hypothetical protein